MDALTALLSVAAVLFGAIIGSFLNALLDRFNTGRGMGGRSFCDRCGHTLGVADLIPIFSYVFLEGKCRYCHARISVQNPLVELAAAALSLFVYLTHPTLFGYAFWFMVWMTLLFIVVYDIRHTVIPWSASGLLALLAFFHLFVSLDTTPAFFFTPDIWSLVAGPVLAAPLVALSVFSRGRWMGWGDGPLQLSLGWLLGLSVGATALMLSFWIGAAVGILLILWGRALPAGKQVTMKSELPFAPFLVLGALVALLFNVDFFSTLPFLFIR